MDIYVCMIDVLQDTCIISLYTLTLPLIHVFKIKQACVQ